MSDLAGGTIIAALPQAVLAFALSEGLRPYDLYPRLGIGPADLEDPDAQVPYRLIVDIWRVILEHIPDRALGLAHARNMRFALFGALGYAVRNAQTLRDAYGTCARFQSLVDPAIRFQSSESGEVWRLEVDHEATVVALGEPMDTIVGGSLVLMRQACGQDIVPLEAHLPHACRHDPAEYRALFGCPVRFGEPCGALVFPASTADLPIPDADQRMHRYLADFLAASLPEQGSREPEDLLSNVRRAIASVIDSPAAAQQHVARRLGMSGRTLQRRLRERGTTFQKILDDERRARYIFSAIEPWPCTRSRSSWGTASPAPSSARSSAGQGLRQGNIDANSSDPPEVRIKPRPRFVSNTVRQPG
jgi:hypothetical protein